MRPHTPLISNLKFALAAGASLGVLAMPSLARAQALTDGRTQPDTAPGSPTANADGDPDRSAMDETRGAIIIVTAQGREQALADVPLAVNAVSGDTLEKAGATDIRELNAVAPSLLVSSTGNEANGSARIRGIGTVGDNPGLESSVAVFVDGVYRSRSGSALTELGPLDRVEILRGPQGTLGGRNASAGLINIYTAPPEFVFSGYGNFSYGNYDTYRAEAGVNVPLGDTLAARVDGVYLKRDGFYHDVVNDTDINNKDRFLVRGQLLFQPNDDLTVRLIGDYSHKNEACCAAVFVDPSSAPLARVSPGLDTFARPQPGAPALTSTQNPIIPVLLALGQDPRAFAQGTFDRDLYMSPGRSFGGKTKDYGGSAQIDYDFGNVSLTAITGYREYSNYQGADADYTGVDILYRAPNRDAGAREFSTFTQEIRLKGTLFDDRLDWLIGGFYAHEKLEVRDNLRFGTQYGAFAPCRVTIALANAGFGAGAVDPRNSGCLGGQTRAVLNSGLSPFGAAGGLIAAGLDTLAQINDRGSVLDVYRQKDENFAFFTHNIVHVTDRLDLTLGLRYTNDSKDFRADFDNDNTFCATNRQRLSPLLDTAAGALAGGIIALSCQGNSTTELNGLNPSDSRKEDEFTGTAILSYKPTDETMVYGSYSRGYKAGGFNLDRSAFTSTYIPGTTASGILLGPLVLGSTANLQFDQETVNAFEIGAKYAGPAFSLSLAAYYQRFRNFQLNTFNGSVFVVQNINGCDADLGPGDTDADATTGACAADDVTAGVIARGVEAEATVSPAHHFSTTLGFSYTDTHYRDSLVGGDNGAPLDPSLRLLPGDNLSNAPRATVTSTLSYTPPLGDSGWTGLFFVNTRMTSDYNTGSDLLYGKEQDGFMVVNGRIGVSTPNDRFSIEGWVANLFDKGYTQVAFNTPFIAPQQIYSAYLAEPRTYGVTVRGKF